MSHLYRPQGQLLGQPKTNFEGKINTIILWSERELKGPRMSMREDKRDFEEEGVAEKKV